VNEVKIDFSDRIRILREKHNMTQLALGRKLGITKSVVSSYETGLHQPKHEILMKVSRLFGVSMNYLYGQEENLVVHNTHVNFSGLEEEDVQEITRLIMLLRAKNSRLKDETNRITHRQ